MKGEVRTNLVAVCLPDRIVAAPPPRASSEAFCYRDLATFKHDRRGEITRIHRAEHAVVTRDQLNSTQTSRTTAEIARGLRAEHDVHQSVAN